MPTREIYDPSTGKIREIWVPEPEAADITELRKQQMEHRIPGAAGTTPPLGFSDESLSPWQAFQTGRARGGPKEIQAVLGGKVMPWPDGNLYWQPEGSQEWRQVNPQGLDWNDLPRVIGETAGPTLGSAAWAATAKGVPGFIAKTALGALTGSLANEGVQTLEGTQRQSQGEQMRQAGLDALLYAAGSAAGMTGAATYPGGAPKMASEHAAKVLKSAVQFQKENPQFPKPLAADIMEETGIKFGPAVVPAPMARSAMRQVEGMTGQLSGAREDLAAQAAGAVDQTFLLPPGARETTNRTLAGAAEKSMEGLKARTVAGQFGAQAGDYRAREALKTGQDVATGLVSNRYQGPLSQAISAEKPVFGLKPLKAAWNAPTLTKTEMDRLGPLGAGDGFEAALVREVEVIPDAAGKVAYLKRVLSTLDDEQTNFEALKRVRTVAGNLGFQGQEDPAAKRLWRDVTWVLENPINKEFTPRYLREFENVNLLNQWKQGMVDDTAVVRAMKTDGSGLLTRAAADDPEAVLTPEFRRLMDLAPKRDREMFLDATRRTMLDSKDPAGMLDNMRITSNPEPYYYLFGGKEGYQAFKAEAEAVSRYWNSAPGQMYQRRLNGYETTRYAVEQVKTPREADDLWRMLSTPEEKEAFQAALIDNTVDAARAPNKKGILKVDDVALRNRIYQMQKNGTWPKLTEDQRRRLEGFADYTQVVLSKTGDTGAMLENASVAANLKNAWHVWDPVAVHRGASAIATLGSNRILAAYATNPARANRLIARLGKTPRNLRRWGMATIFAIPPGSEAVDTEIIDPTIEYVNEIVGHKSASN